MSTTLKPFGLKPAYHQSGLDRAVPFVGTNSFTGNDYNAPYSLSVGQAFYQYQPVAINGSGQLTIAGAAPANSTVYGVFDGVEFTDSQGRRSVSKWISKAALDASSQIVFWIFQDQALIYEIQATGSIPATSIGKQFNFSTVTNYTTADGISIGVGGAGFSTTALNPNAVANGQLRVVGLGREAAYPAGELNQWNDAYTIVQVEIANDAFPQGASGTSGFSGASGASGTSGFSGFSGA
jgi:hypothetical protein